MDIKPVRKRPATQPPQITKMADTSQPQPSIQEAMPIELNLKKKFPFKKVLIWSGLGVLAVVIATILTSWLWYQGQLRPLGEDANEHIQVTITQGATPAQIADLLEEKKIIRSSFAFSIYARFSNTQNLLQAGSYRLTPADSTPAIVEHLVSGNVDTFDITFYPGATLAESRDVLIKAGYGQDEVDAALQATYNSPLFDSKPASTDLEGYILGDTYRFGSGASAEDILQYTFDAFESLVVENDLVAKFKAQGLNLYEGITLASIVQRESGGNDKPQIARVFYNRMALGMELGSDVTYQYIADKTGTPRDPNLDSPYNTRRYPGLPPGPIAAPGLQALLGVANPADSDFLFFLSGDDDVTYYSTDFAGHEQNIADHCKEKCKIL